MLAFRHRLQSVEEAYPGDVIGIHNPGHFAIGDTLFTGTNRIAYPAIPSFSPEKFSYIRNPNPASYKKFAKGISELLDEGAVQMLRNRGDDGTCVRRWTRALNMPQYASICFNVVLCTLCELQIVIFISALVRILTDITLI